MPVIVGCDGRTAELSVPHHQKHSWEFTTVGKLMDEQPSIAPKRIPVCASFFPYVNACGAASRSVITVMPLNADTILDRSFVCTWVFALRVCDVFG